MSRLERSALTLLLLIAAALRLTGLDWDDFQHHHPDERYITWVATTIEFPSPGSLSRADWQPETSTFNPFRWPPQASSEGIVVLQGERRDFAYGHVPLYLGVLATRLAERLGGRLIPLLPDEWSLTTDVLNGAGRIEFHHLAAVGRALTALIDTGTVLLTYLLGRRLYGPVAGLLAAAFLTVTVLHIQLAHFFTSDPYLTFFTIAALYAMVEAHSAIGRQRQVGLFVAAALVGLAVGSKFTAVLLLAPLAWTVAAGGAARRPWTDGLLALGIAGLVFALTNPFALLDLTCPLPEQPRSGPAIPEALARSCYLQNVAEQNAMVRGTADLGFARQYAGTLPYLYFVEMQVRWGMGPLLGLLAFGGLVWVLWGLVWPANGAGRLSGRALWQSWLKDPAIIPVLWVLPYFLLTGSFAVKFMRYMQPIIPLLVIFGAGLVMAGGRRAVGCSRLNPSRRTAAAALAILGFTAVYALAFIAIYGQPHPWNLASRWVYETVPPGTALLAEQWDDYLPVPLSLDGERRRREEYPHVELTWLTGPDVADSETKLTANLEALASADYVTILSNRVYGVVPRLPGRYPLSSQYHQLLFDGRLGYEPVWVGGRVPRFLGVALVPDTFSWPGLTPPATVDDFLFAAPHVSFGRVDESFVVYDQPLTIVFRNTGGMTAAQMRAQFR